MAAVNPNGYERARLVGSGAGVNTMPAPALHIVRGPLEPHPGLTAAGFRFGNRDTRTSRTIMLAELEDLLAAVPGEAERDAYSQGEEHSR